MLDELHVADLALIEDAWIEFGPGMTVLTGETGAGKTALLGALKLLLGERADSGAVRGGAPEALVEGRFSSAGDEIVAKRRVSADGRSKCMLDGGMSTVSALAARLGPLVDLHGQHEHQALLSAATHVGYLDRWAGASATAALGDYRRALADYRAAVVARDALAARVAEGVRNADYLRFVSDEIDRVDPQPDEDADLEARVPALKHAEQLSEAVSAVVTLLRGDGGALDGVGKAQAALRRVGGIDPRLDEIAQRLTDVEAVVDDIGASARAYRDGIEHDPRALDQMMNRLGELSGLMRKYGPSLDDVLARRDEARAALTVVDDSDEAMRQAEVALSSAELVLRREAENLSALRREAAPGFLQALAAAVSDLAMEGARFEVAAEDLPFGSWNADGPQRVEFLYAPSIGAPARPLAKIASGGEISRVMLALKGVLGEADSVETLVFDEVDAGIGGATAHAVGRRLAYLARTHQVIVVTHLAQVAAYADTHLVVRKNIVDGAASTTVVTVEAGERLAEIARMLSGNESDASLAHATELVESARRSRSAA